MGLSLVGLQTRPIHTGGAVDLHECHWAGVPVGPQAVGELKGAHPCLQGSVQNLRLRRVRGGLASRWITGPPLPERRLAL